MSNTSDQNIEQIHDKAASFVQGLIESPHKFHAANLGGFLHSLIDEAYNVGVNELEAPPDLNVSMLDLGETEDQLEAQLSRIVNARAAVQIELDYQDTIAEELQEILDSNQGEPAI